MHVILWGECFVSVTTARPDPGVPEAKGTPSPPESFTIHGVELASEPWPIALSFDFTDDVPASWPDADTSWIWGVPGEGWPFRFVLFPRVDRVGNWVGVRLIRLSARLWPTSGCRHEALRVGLSTLAGDAAAWLRSMPRFITR